MNRFGEDFLSSSRFAFDDCGHVARGEPFAKWIDRAHRGAAAEHSSEALCVRRYSRDLRDSFAADLERRAAEDDDLAAAQERVERAHVFDEDAVGRSKIRDAQSIGRDFERHVPARYELVVEPKRAHFTLPDEDARSAADDDACARRGPRDRGEDEVISEWSRCALCELRRLFVVRHRGKLIIARCRRCRRETPSASREDTRNANSREIPDARIGMRRAPGPHWRISMLHRFALAFLASITALACGSTNELTSSTSADLAKTPKPPTGLMMRSGNPPPASTQSFITSTVAMVDWATIQPTSSSDQNWTALDNMLATYANDGISHVRLRIMSGGGAPTWVKRLGAPNAKAPYFRVCTVLEDGDRLHVRRERGGRCRGERPKVRRVRPVFLDGRIPHCV